MSEQLIALLTSHNRAASTVACLQRLADQRADDLDVRAVLVDAGSTDGTVEEVTRQFSFVEVLRADPDTFWNGGMRTAYEAAVNRNPDYFLWLNDDTLLDPDALTSLIHTERICRESRERAVLVVGSTRDPSTGELTYGGVRQVSARRPLRFRLVEPSERPQLCDTANGNVVLVSRKVARVVGNLDATFTHAFGDYDYGLRLSQFGGEVWTSPGTVGVCARNAPRVPDKFAQELRHLRSPKGLPLREWGTFARRWGGPLWPIYALSPYVRRLTMVLRRKSSSPSGSGAEPVRSGNAGK